MTWGDLLRAIERTCDRGAGASDHYVRGVFMCGEREGQKRGGEAILCWVTGKRQGQFLAR